MYNYILNNIRKLKPLLNRNNSLKEEKVYDGVFYMLEKDNHYFYIGGSIHLGTNDKVRFNNAVEKAYKNSTKIAVEFDTTNLKNKVNFFKILSNISEDKIPLDSQNFEPDLFKTEDSIIKYKNLCKELRLNFEKCSKLSPEKFYFIIQQSLIRKAGYKPSYGMDMLFINRAKHDRKEVVSLETPSTQINAIISAANLSPEALGNNTIRSLEDLEISIKSLSKMHNAVFEGDTLTLVNDILIYKPKNESDKNNLNILLFERNKNMANKIESLIESQEVYFVIVGASHVVGKGGLLKLFKDKGYKISRLK